MEGTFVPLATPAIVGDRMYLPTAFWPHNINDTTNKEFYLRLYAMDITDNQVDRIRVAWISTKTITGYLPTLEGNYKDCSQMPPPSIKGSDLALGIRPVGHVTVLDEALVVLGLNFNNVPGGYDRYLVLGVLDQGKTFQEKFYSDASYNLLVSTSSLNYLTTRQFKKDRDPFSVQDFFLMATVSSESATPVTTIDVTNASNNALLGKISLDSIFSPLTKVQLTSDLMSFELDLPASKQDDRPPFSTMYVVFGFAGLMSNGTEETGLAGIEIGIKATGTLLWKISTPDKCSPVGLLPSLKKEEEYMLIVSTQCGLTAYKL